MIVRDPHQENHAADAALAIDAEICRSRLERVVAEADDATVLWLSGIVQAALAPWCVPSGPAAG